MSLDSPHDTRPEAQPPLTPTDGRDEANFTIVVAALTCDRHEMLEKLLVEFSQIELPKNATTILLIVDNNADGSSRMVVERYRSRIPELRYVSETSPGIPVARNRAIDESLELKADALCFIDDDEFPGPQWLTELCAAWRDSNLDLIGGPVEVASCCPTLGWWHRLINLSLARRQRRKNRQAAHRSMAGRQPTIVTNNWLCDIRWLKQSGIRFDTRLLFTGGSDTAFFRAAVADGCNTSWCPDAVVHETMPRNRLKLRYQFRRGISQSLNHFHLKHDRVTPIAMAITAFNASIRFILGCVLFLVPVFGVASLVMSVRSLGWSVGRLMGLFGHQSKLYDRGVEERQSHDTPHLPTAPRDRGTPPNSRDLDIDHLLDGPDQLTAPVVKRLFQETRGHRLAFGVAIAAMACVAAATAGLAWLMRSVINEVFVERNLQAVWAVAGAIVALSVIKGAAEYTQSLIMARISNRMVASLKCRMFRKILDSRMDFFTKAHSSKLVARFSNGARAATAALDLITTGLARNFLTLVGLVAVMVIQNPTLSLVAVLAGPVMIPPVQKIIRKLRTLSSSEFDGIEAGISAVQETCQGIGTVKSFNLEPIMQARIDQAVADVEARGNSIARIGKLTSPLMETIGGITIAAMIVYAAWQTTTDGTSPGEFMSFMTAMLLAYEPAKRIVKERVNLSRFLNRTRKMYNLLDAPVEEHRSEQTISLSDFDGRVEVSGLSFGYSRKTVLHDVTMEVRPGEVVALVGPSGAGKSTLFSLMQRFYDPQGGSIFLNGKDIAEIDPRSVRQLISVVNQHTTLFSGTIGENIGMGKPLAAFEEIERAAKAACAFDFISAMPQGFDTPVAERHASLSGGQAQRLAIARAVLKDAPILLLDEATSALDTETEREVQQALRALMKGRTTIVIAHRRSTIVQADRIYVLQAGRVVQAGRHEELMCTSELYRSLFGKAVDQPIPVAA